MTVERFHRPTGRWWILNLIVVLILAGCGSDEVASPTPSPAPMVIAVADPTATPMPPTAVPTATATAVPTATPTTSPYVNPLTGLPVEDPDVLRRRPILVRVGNDPVARGILAGLSEADVVFEEIMDSYGITRYTAVFLAHDPIMIRPVRSARLINIELATQFDGALAHAGASDEIRWRISQAPFVDLDEFFHPEPYTYGPGDWRTRLYTNIPRLREYLQERGLDQPVELKGWVFDPTPPAHGTPAPTVFIPYPNGPVTWRYNPVTGLYERSVDNIRAIDANNGEVLAAANVIAFYAEHRDTDIVEDSLGSTAIDIVMLGEGPIQLFRDGIMVEGFWQRNKPSELMRFIDPTGQPLPLKPGQTWVEILPTNRPAFQAQIINEP